MPVTTSKHVVASCVLAWGHARPMITFAARLVQLDPDVRVTVLVTAAHFDRLVKESTRSFEEGDTQAAQRLRIVCVGQPNHPLGDGCIGPFWKTLLAGEGPVCAQTGTQHSAWPKPNAVVLDIFAVQDTKIVRSISGSSVKVYSWWPGETYTFLCSFGDKKIGGRGNLHQQIEEEVSRSGRSYMDVSMEMINVPRGEVVELPGHPPMYDWELSPQQSLIVALQFPLPDEFALSIFPLTNASQATVDGIISISFESWEPEAFKLARKWFGETGRPVYIAGPLLPTASKATLTANEKSQSAEGAEIQKLLDDTLARSGPQSLLYMSFGSIFWPVGSPEKVWAFLDVLMEMDIPFIMSHASPMAVVPDEVKAKVKEYGKGILSPWTPQQTVLSHPATGWYVCHGGQNGLTEAIAASVPMIMWPFNADQPSNTALATDVHKIGYELLEVRTAHGLNKVYRTGYTPVGTVDAVKAEARRVLTQAFGEDGKEKRARLPAIREAMLGEWKEDGRSRRDVLAFLESL
ncbi:UDP-Glycosyltransferase/glycogen phosphorylase [Epithele typhae]|uniref:UDP-Glycosyltransferase/glycogen phosphorylase n=1 Tax=Epithele typhae TaxID=378194 RepID=UPI002007D31A|nr:UDP-Glycosyltransferase/glycogen phosphorylase [Epithele typhae]KAH9914496.1 UDP-Glycosyltransferase/glycogen phosphorylase [Epithele typhae]